MVRRVYVHNYSPYMHMYCPDEDGDSHLAGKKTWDGGPIPTHARNSSGRLATCVIIIMYHTHRSS